MTDEQISNDTRMPWAVMYDRDQLGGVYPAPMVAGEYCTLGAARAACQGGRWIVHTPTGKRYYPREHLWLDDEGREVAPPDAISSD
jgi:hypothetical protein